MTEVKGPAIASNKLAMSRALGAAFLNHQVEQLEKTVTSSGPGTGNWRDRRSHPAHNHNGSPESKRVRAVPGPKGPKRRDVDGVDYEGGEGKMRRRDEHQIQKDADIVVVDASVLVHALAQVKKWCRDGREEILIVPLEALNTLDLLKKGTSTLAQRARAASRILEAQVGTNPRIRVQRDDAFVLWDSVFQDQVPGVNPGGSPEWVRRTICCARWEVEHAGDKDGNSSNNSDADEEKKPRVVLAVLSQSSDVQSEAIGMPTSTVPSPVPLPAPQTNRHEPRSSGALVTLWANKARLDLFEVNPTFTPGSATTPNGVAASQDTSPSGRRSAETPRRSAEEERGKRGLAPGIGARGRRNSHLRAGNERGASTPGSRPGSSAGLVERPPAVMAMMEMVAQPSRVVRVLARGEKLDPDS